NNAVIADGIDYRPFRRSRTIPVFFPVLAASIGYYLQRIGRDDRQRGPFIRLIALMILARIPQRGAHPLTGNRHPWPAKRILRPGPTAAPGRPGALMRHPGEIDPDRIHPSHRLMRRHDMPG